MGVAFFFLGEAAFLAAAGFLGASFVGAGFCFVAADVSPALPPFAAAKEI